MKILVGMSGGVDSSMSAVLLKQAGHEVTGIHFVFWSEEGKSNKCCSVRDLNFAKDVSRRYDFPFVTYDYRESFKRDVVDAYVEMIDATKTPNPCINCNQKVKFGKLIEVAMEMGMDKLVTGHYAQVTERDGVFRLLKGVDEQKDQSYFLHQLTQEKLSKVMFPLGGVQKDKVKELAEKFGVVNHDRVKKESQDLCFIPEKTPEEFLKRHLGEEKWGEGEIVDESGRTVGQHRGLPFYTHGQRKGLNIGGLKDPLYVIGKDSGSNRLVVGRRDAVVTDRIQLKKVNLIAGGLDENKEYEMKIRYRGKGIGGKVKILGKYAEDEKNSIQPQDAKRFCAEVFFSQPVDSVTPGQYLVIYDGEECVGGGEIV